MCYKKLFLDIEFVLFILNVKSKLFRFNINSVKKINFSFY